MTNFQQSHGFPDRHTIVLFIFFLQWRIAHWRIRKIWFSPQLKDLLVRTIDSYVNLFMQENHLQLPILKMELTFDDEKMQFYPPVEDLEEVVLFVIKQICKTMQHVSKTE